MSLIGITRRLEDECNRLHQNDEVGIFPTRQQEEAEWAIRDAITNIEKANELLEGAVK